MQAVGYQRICTLKIIVAKLSVPNALINTRYYNLAQTVTSVVGEEGHFAVLISLLFKSKVEHTFICVFAIPISFSVNCWFLSFACLSLDLLVFFLLICLSSFGN